ncbi:hypothetical protein AYI69_g10002 [Smittium culicis]|uniref:tRNA-splicing endonuclease subunit Sen15 domain-containing protein n=1 Tax=Smittium culicis TaxID=133412 RepID=A0A1R1X8U0_9FUNG|nr:hypothetical protein AYI69_g10002 [Smittium culicis]
MCTDDSVFLPISASQKFSIETIESFIDSVAESKDKLGIDQIDCIKLAIVGDDSTVVYYNINDGFKPPPE